MINFPALGRMRAKDALLSVADAKIYDTYSYEKYPLGTKKELEDGSIYRFAYAGASNLAHGKLNQSPAAVADHTNIPVAATVAAGALSITATLAGSTAAAANLYAKGYIWVNDATGEGHLYRIKEHAAVAGGGIITATLEPASPVEVALVTTTSEVSLMQNKFKNLIIHPSPPTGRPAGIFPVDVAANNYGWLQTKGPAAALVQGTWVAGDHVVPSATVDGALMPSAAFETDGPVIGWVMSVNADTEYGLVNLTLE